VTAPAFVPLGPRAYRVNARPIGDGHPEYSYQSELRLTRSGQHIDLGSVSSRRLQSSSAGEWLDCRRSPTESSRKRRHDPSTAEAPLRIQLRRPRIGGARCWLPFGKIRVFRGPRDQPVASSMSCQRLFCVYIVARSQCVGVDEACANWAGGPLMTTSPPFVCKSPAEIRVLPLGLELDGLPPSGRGRITSKTGPTVCGICWPPDAAPSHAAASTQQIQAYRWRLGHRAPRARAFFDKPVLQAHASQFGPVFQQSAASDAGFRYPWFMVPLASAVCKHQILSNPNNKPMPSAKLMPPDHAGIATARAPTWLGTSHPSAMDLWRRSRVCALRAGHIGTG